MKKLIILKYLYFGNNCTGMKSTSSIIVYWHRIKTVLRLKHVWISFDRSMVFVLKLKSNATLPRLYRDCIMHALRSHHDATANLQCPNCSMIARSQWGRCAVAVNEFLLVTLLRLYCDPTATHSMTLVLRSHCVPTSLRSKECVLT